LVSVPSAECCSGVLPRETVVLPHSSEVCDMERSCRASGSTARSSDNFLSFDSIVSEPTLNSSSVWELSPEFPSLSTVPTRICSRDFFLLNTRHTKHFLQSFVQHFMPVLNLIRSLYFCTLSSWILSDVYFLTSSTFLALFLTPVPVFILCAVSSPLTFSTLHTIFSCIFLISCSFLLFLPFSLCFQSLPSFFNFSFFSVFFPFIALILFFIFLVSWTSLSPLFFSVPFSTYSESYKTSKPISVLLSGSTELVFTLLRLIQGLLLPEVGLLVMEWGLNEVFWIPVS